MPSSIVSSTTKAFFRSIFLFFALSIFKYLFTNFRIVYALILTGFNSSGRLIKSNSPSPYRHNRFDVMILIPFECLRPAHIHGQIDGTSRMLTMPKLDDEQALETGVNKMIGRRLVANNKNKNNKKDLLLHIPHRIQQRILFGTDFSAGIGFTRSLGRRAAYSIFKINSHLPHREARHKFELYPK